jgi:dynein heavy chain
MSQNGRSAEFKSIGGQPPTLMHRKQVPLGNSLPSLPKSGNGDVSLASAGGAAASTSLAAEPAGVKQRGILSEVVRVHQPEEISACKLGPMHSHPAADGQHNLHKQGRPTGFQLSSRMRGKAQEALPVARLPTTAEVEPKVVEVYSHRPGDRPRKVTVERKQKWFESLDIEQLLVERGISFKPSNWNDEHWLQLDDFDNTEYDIRTPEEWVSQGIQDDGTMLPVRAAGLRLESEAGGAWQDCVVTGLDEDRRFNVQWVGDESSDTDSLSRLQILFNGEDPELFADRIQFAFESLRRAQSRARLNFFIDNMPIDDIQCLDVDQVSRILDLAKNSPALRDAGIEPAGNDLVREANLDFARTMNKIIFIHQPVVAPEQTRTGSKDENNGWSLFDTVDVEELEDDLENPFSKPVPYYALWPVEEYNFTQTFSSFCFASLYIKSEVVSTLCSVAEECLYLLAQCIYTTRFTKALKLEQFLQLEKTGIIQMAHRVKDNWIVNLQKIVLKNFDQVGKGWFSIHETNLETYRQGKMKKLLAVICFMMEDTMRYFTLDSIAAYCESIEAYCPAEVNVESLLKVTSKFGPSPSAGEAAQAPPRLLHQAAVAVGEAASRAHRRHSTDPNTEGGEQSLAPRDPMDGLFHLELKASDDKQRFVYSSEGSRAVDVCTEVLEMGLTHLQDMPQLEAHIVPQLFRTVVHKQVLNTVGINESWVQERKAKLEAMVRRTLPALKEYLELFKPYEELLRMDPAEYVAEKGLLELTTEETKALVNEHLASEQQVLAEIPECVTVGFFEVSCMEIRKTLASRHKKAADLLLELILSKFRDSTQDICDMFTGVFAQLRKAPKKIEESTELKEYMSNVPTEVKKLEPDINKCITAYNILESFGVKMNADDSFQRWRVFQSPKQTFDMMAQVEDDLKQSDSSFASDMAAEQSEFDDNLLDLAGIIETFAQYSDISKVKEIYENVESVNERLKQANAQAKLFNCREVLFGKESSDYSQLQALQKEWDPFSQLWVTAYHWIDDSEKWMNGPFGEIDSKHCEASVFNGTKTLFKVVKAFEKREDSGKVLDIAKDIKEKIDEFQPYVPIVTGLRNAGMRDRHWETITNMVGSEVKPDMEDFTLNNFVNNLNMLPHAQEIQDIGDRSGKELSIEKQLRSMKAAWEDVKFDCSEPYRTTETYILKGADDVMALLDEQIVMSQAMQFSPFNKPFKEDIDEWAAKLLYVSECLDAWLKVQRAWMYLQPIFDSPDIMKQLPTEGKKFKLVDGKWRQVMGKLHNNGHALNACSQEGLLDTWTNANNDLDLVQKGLEDYLETKRGAFARFYFLSNDELLEILSQTKDPLRVQPFLSKVFEAMKKLTFTKELSATQMVSKEGEIIDFVNFVHTPNKNVEVWMTEVEDQMIAAVREVIKIGIEAYVEKKRTDWVLTNPGQVVLNSSQVHWTAEVEAAIKEGTIPEYYQKLATQLMDLVYLVRGDITKLQRLSIGALVVIDVHAKDTTENLVKCNITDAMSFEWISQLRYYWEVDDRNTEHCWVRMVQTPFPYGYEYLGNSFRLVITPLTDMCYMTLMGAQSLNLGGAPAGPAGTGKTESTKDLAKALAKQCVVFNCSPEMDYLMVGKFFKGLASTGAWCCFDEFNRIYIEVLSVIAQQLLQLFSAKQEIASYSESIELEFDSTLIRMRPTFNVFITMNPGYAGRTELPDNLAALFRPMAMMVPDYAMIGEISFYAFGFENGRHLAKKMVTTFQLCSEQLSAQCHYDYGMRAVKTVIEAAGLNKRKYPDQSESQILLRALRDVNVPKFLRDDLPLFENIINDLFPGVERPEMDYGRLGEACDTESKAQHLQPVDAFVKKQFELFDMIQVRHGMMLVGPTGGGKTACYRTLQRACTSLFDASAPNSAYQKVHVHCLNPKAITQNQLYGSFDEVTREWSDGIAAEEIRNAVRDNANPDHHWIMFDGPVDALWIESMNTVLDDNKKLCLVSGEIIALTDKMRMQFEVEDLEVASPATVSRCGMIYLEPESLGFQVLFDSWLEVLPETLKFKKEYHERLKSLCEELIAPSLHFVRKQCKEVVRSQDTNLIQSLFRLMDCYFAKFQPTELRPAMAFREEVAEYLPCIRSLFYFCMMWSIGGSCEGPSRKKFSDYMWATSSTELMEQFQAKNAAAHLHYPHVQEFDQFKGLEPGTLLYDYYYNSESKEWVPWMKTIPHYEVPRNARYEDVVVPSIDSVRLVYIFQLLARHDKHVLCPGPTGTGKSVNIQIWLQKQAPDNFQSILVNFSAQTHVNQFQDLIDGKIEKRRRGVYGPPPGKRMVIFVDDLNMPQKEYYGAQPPLELIRQAHDHKGWFNRKELKKFEITDVIWVSAMGPPGGGRTYITERLKRHYSILAYSDLQDESIRQIFETMCNYFFVQFDQSVQDHIPSFITSTVSIFKQALSDLLPTPAKSHYLFNLRDIWRVFLGLCGLSSKKANDPVVVVRCWCHEIQRIFGDRLTDKQDLAWMKTQIETQLSGGFKMEVDTVYARERLIFASFMNQDVENRFYEEVTDLKVMKEAIEDYLEDYNNVFTITMPLVMFLDACEHCSRICRVLDQPNGNALLLGVGGSGRQSLTRLSSYMCDNECFQIEVAKGYGMNEFRDDLKKCLMKCGVEDKVQIFLFTDTQIVKEDFVEAVNNILNSGDVPNLYAVEDMESIATACRAVCQQMGLQPTKANVFSAYLTRVKKNVHVVLAFSPVGDSFRNRLRMFPSLVNCCTIDWFHEWPAEALYSVAKQQLTNQGVDLPNFEGSLKMFQLIHQSVEASAERFLAQLKRHIHVTPTSYLELLSSFANILAMKRKQVGTQQNRYKVGLEKIGDAEQQVTGLQQMLTEKKPVLEQTQKEVAEKMAVIKVDKAEADEVSKVVKKEEEEARVKAEETEEIKDSAQRDLDEALPALDQAVQCLKKLKQDHIREVKALTNPPAGVRLACEAVCIMFGLKPVKKNDPNTPGKKIDDYWETSKLEVLANPKELLDKLFNFDRDNIPDKIIQTITPYMDREDFDPAAIKKASIACEAICMWTRAMYKYHFVAVGVEPKRVLLRQAQAELDECTEKLRLAQDRLRDVQMKIEKLEYDLRIAEEKLEELAADMKMCEIKLERAHKLIGGLGGEKARWGENVSKLTAELTLLPGDCIVAAGVVSYAGPFTSDYRLEFESLWLSRLDDVQITHNEECTMRHVLGEPVKIQQWVVYTLPNDALSIENGIIIDRSRRWPLMIDPQRQANKYIKNMGKDMETGFDVCKMSDSNFLRTLELGIQFGKWILLENIGINLDPALEPILQQQKVKDSGSGYIIKLGDKSITYSDTFKFFMTTTLPNPHYSPETSVKVTLLNFAITPIGLEDQMLGIVVIKERPELEEQKNQLVVQNAKMNKQLKEIEDEILHLLSTSEGDVLEDDTLVDKVTASKKVAEDIQEKQLVANETEKDIDAARESYRPLAYRTAVLFFCIVELTNIDPMYQYSLQWFQTLFAVAIDMAPKSDVFDERLNILKDFFTESLYQNICRGLFEKDKTLFSFALCIRIMKGDNNMDEGDLRFLLVGPTSDLTEGGPKIPTEWVGKQRWNEILALSMLPGFKGFEGYFQRNIPAFKKIYDSVEAEKEVMPGEWEQKLTRIQKLCFVRAFRLDCLKSAIIEFISHELGQKFVEPPTFDITKSFADSVNTTPLIFILSPGTDPVSDVVRFAEKMGMAKRFESISLGQGQGPKATKLIESAQGMGGWVLLSNCHLMESWMTTLEAIVEQLNPESMSNNFRLWLTSMPAKSFPVQVLQNGVKMTNEPPSGLRANLLRSYSIVTDKLFEESNKPEIFKNLIFGFCFFHAVVQDRRKFGPIGWNIPYGFTPEDLSVCRQQLMLFVNQYDEVPYKVLNFLGAKINYGGRVTDDKDKLLISTILETYMCPKAVELGEEYKYSSSGLYYPPKADTVAETVEYIRTLPLYPMPEAFGLHFNCNITCAQAEAEKLLDGMTKMIGSGGGEGGGKSADDVMDEAAASVQERLPTPFPLDIVEEKFPTMYEESMNTVVKQECLRYNKLLWEMEGSLKDFRKAIKGFIVMTTDLEDTGKSMFINEVPELWAKKGPLSLKPLSSWFLDIIARCQFFQSWFDLGKTPPVHWISGIFFPQAFFTGAMQNFARKYGEEIDLLSFAHKALDDVQDPKRELTSPPEDGVYHYGMFLEGARWDTTTHQLEESHPKELFTELPAFWFVPVKNRVPNPTDYRCPTYKVLSRKGVLLTTGHSTNFVLYLELPTDQLVSKWIKAGVATFLALKH